MEAASAAFVTSLGWRLMVRRGTSWLTLDRNPAARQGAGTSRARRRSAKGRA